MSVPLVLLFLEGAKKEANWNPEEAGRRVSGVFAEGENSESSFVRALP